MRKHADIHHNPKRAASTASQSEEEFSVLAARGGDIGSIWEDSVNLINIVDTKTFYCQLSFQLAR